MIESVCTLSRAQAQSAVLETRRSGGVAWIGFATVADGPSPIDLSLDEPALLLNVHDVGCDQASADEYDLERALASNVSPKPAHAESIVDFVLGLHRDRNAWRLFVHCHGGQYRSGAVAEWLVTEFSIPESSASCRLQALGIGLPLKTRTYNATILRLLREAYAEKRGHE